MRYILSEKDGTPRKKPIYVQLYYLPYVKYKADLTLRKGVPSISLKKVFSKQLSAESTSQSSCERAATP